MHSLGEVEWALLGCTTWLLATPDIFTHVGCYFVLETCAGGVWENPLEGLGSPCICHFIIELSPFGHLTVLNLVRSL